MSYTSPKLLTFQAFIEQYGDNPRYELIDGELRDMEPTGPHEAVAGSLAGRVYADILRLNLNWLIPKNCLIKPPAAEATALRPDVIVLDKQELSREPLWQQEPIICNGNRDVWNTDLNSPVRRNADSTVESQGCELSGWTRAKDGEALP